jgi:hypothetical protein
MRSKEYVCSLVIAGGAVSNLSKDVDVYSFCVLCVVYSIRRVLICECVFVFVYV